MVGAGPCRPSCHAPKLTGPKPGVDMELGIPFTAMFLSREEALGMKTAALSSQSREKVGHRTKAGPPWKPVQPLATARLPGCSLVQRPSARGPWGASPPPLRFLKPRLGPAEPTPGGGGEARGVDQRSPHPKEVERQGGVDEASWRLPPCPGPASPLPPRWPARLLVQDAHVQVRPPSPESWWGAGPPPGHRDSGAGGGLGQGGPWLCAFPSWPRSRVHAGGNP